MKTRAAVLWGLKEPWRIQEIHVDPPKSGEVLVRWRVAGLCHSDEHLVTGDMVPPAKVLEATGTKFFPIIGGHEGAVPTSSGSRRATTSRRASSPPAVDAGTASPDTATSATADREPLAAA
jgi:threonine dehydrogenase-like Zn-dependent dehydrogenase